MVVQMREMTKISDIRDISWTLIRLHVYLFAGSKNSSDVSLPQFLLHSPSKSYSATFSSPSNVFLFILPCSTLSLIHHNRQIVYSSPSSQSNSNPITSFERTYASMRSILTILTNISSRFFSKNYALSSILIRVAWKDFIDLSSSKDPFRTEFSHHIKAKIENFIC